MTEYSDGGPAFPVIGAPGAPEDFPGMTLRDYFAAKAMQAIVRPGGDGTPAYCVAGRAYAFADAMLAARDKP